MKFAESRSGEGGDQESVGELNDANIAHEGIDDQRATSVKRSARAVAKLAKR
jgi:hypothetical protein